MNQTVVPISITQSLIKGYVDGKGENMSAQDIISYCARISNPSNQDNFATSEKLLDYLVDHKHWSPFEMSDMTMEINTTRDISRQILRHRMAPAKGAYRSGMNWRQKATNRSPDDANRSFWRRFVGRCIEFSSRFITSDQPVSGIG